MQEEIELMDRVADPLMSAASQFVDNGGTISKVKWNTGYIPSSTVLPINRSFLELLRLKDEETFNTLFVVMSHAIISIHGTISSSPTRSAPENGFSTGWHFQNINCSYIVFQFG